MPYNKVSYREKCEVIGYVRGKNTPKDAAAEFGIPLSTIYWILKNPPTPKKKSGRPRIIDTPTRKRLVDFAIASRANRRLSYAQQIRLAQINCSAHTLYRMFKNEGYQRYLAKKKHLLTAEQKENRLQFAIAHLFWTIEDWFHVLWTDESYMWLGGGGFSYVTRRQDEALHEDCIDEMTKSKHSVMVWGGFMGGEKVPLQIWEKDDWGTITALSYLRHVLYPVIIPFIIMWQAVGWPVILMEDGASAHTADISKSARQAFSVVTLIWPSWSPDLNPIEHIWGIIKKRIRERPIQPSTTAEMRVAVLEEWDKITPENLYRILATMPDRMAAVIAANGGHTKY